MRVSRSRNWSRLRGDNIPRPAGTVGTVSKQYTIATDCDDDTGCRILESSENGLGSLEKCWSKEKSPVNQSNMRADMPGPVPHPFRG